MHGIRVLAVQMKFAFSFLLERKACSHTAWTSSPWASACYQAGAGDATGRSKESEALSESSEEPPIGKIPRGGSYQPDSPKAHRFEVALTEHDTQNSMYWAEHLSVQPTKKGKALGEATECDDCVRTEVMPWPQDADGFSIDFVPKKRSDTVMVNWFRLFLPYI